MAFDQLSSNDKARLNSFMDGALKVLQEIDDLKAGLNDTAKALAEEFNTKPSRLLKAARHAYKASINDAKEEVAEIENILDATGRA